MSSPVVTSKWQLPKGPIPRSSGIAMVGIFLGVVLTVLYLINPGRKALHQKAIVTDRIENASPQDVRGAMAQLQEQQARLQAEKERQMAQNAAMHQNLQEAQQQQNPYVIQGQQQPQMTPEQARQQALMQARIDIEVGDLKREYASRFTPIQVISMREPKQDIRETKPGTNETKAPTAETKQAANEYILHEGYFLPTTLVNRIDSTFSGPVIVMVSEDIWDEGHSCVLIPQGSRVIGEAAAVSALGQKRVAIAFHRILRYRAAGQTDSVSLDQFVGLNQIGETGLRDKVNNHYLQIFGTSIAIGLIGAVAQGSANYGYNTDGWDLAQRGIGAGMSQAAFTVLNRFLNIPPTVTIREGHRVKVYFSGDVRIPAYEEKQQ